MHLWNHLCETIPIFSGNGQVRHYHIKKTPEEKFYLAISHAFLTIPDLIYYHKHNAGGIATRLRAPPSKGSKTAPQPAGFGHSKWEVNRNELELFEVLGSGCFGVCTWYYISTYWYKLFPYMTF